MRNKTEKHSTLCWDCKKSFGGCAWSREFKPIEGWKAKLTKIKNGVGIYTRNTDSFDVYECPEFELRERLKGKRTTEKKVRKESKKANINSIKRFLEECGVSQAQLASKSQLGRATVSRWVNRCGGSQNSLKKIADALGVSVKDLEDKCKEEGGIK